MRTPEDAEAFLDSHDKDIREGRPVHRVTSLFCSISPLSFRVDMLEFIRTGMMSRRLHQIIEGYRMCVIDDTVGERPHSLVGKVAEKKPAAKLPYLCAYVRCPQNEPLLETAHMNTVCRYFRNWKIIFQESSTKKSHMRPKRLPTPAALHKVYLTGPESLCLGDSVPDNPMMQTSTSVPIISNPVMLRVKREFIEAVLDLNCFYSVKVVDIIGKENLSEYMTGLNSDTLIFQVIDLNVMSKKLVQNRHAVTGDWKCAIQFYRELRIAGEDTDSGSLTVFPYGSSQNYSLATLIPWDTWRFGLVQWKESSSSYTGCFELTSPTTERVWSLLWNFPNPGQCFVSFSLASTDMIIAMLVSARFLEDETTQPLAGGL